MPKSVCLSYHENPTKQSGHEFAQQSGTQTGNMNKGSLRETDRRKRNEFDSLQDRTTDYILSPVSSSVQQKPSASKSCLDSDKFMSFLDGKLKN